MITYEDVNITFKRLGKCRICKNLIFLIRCIFQFTVEGDLSYYLEKYNTDLRFIQ